MVDPKIRVGVLVPVLWVDVGCKAHRVGIAGPDGSLLEEFAIPHSQEGFRYPKNGHREFFDRSIFECLWLPDLTLNVR